MEQERKNYETKLPDSAKKIDVQPSMKARIIRMKDLVGSLNDKIEQMNAIHFRLDHEAQVPPSPEDSKPMIEETLNDSLMGMEDKLVYLNDRLYSMNKAISSII